MGRGKRSWAGSEPGLYGLRVGSGGGSGRNEESGQKEMTAAGSKKGMSEYEKMHGLLSIIFHQGSGPACAGKMKADIRVGDVHTCNGPIRPRRSSGSGCLSGCRCTYLCWKSGETVKGGGDGAAAAGGGDEGLRSKYCLGIEAGDGKRGVDGRTKHALLMRAPPAAAAAAAAVVQQAMLAILCVHVDVRIELAINA